MSSKRKLTTRPQKPGQQYPADDEVESITISIEKLNEQLQTLKHEIDIETIQKRIKVYESFFKRLGDEVDILFEMIDWYKKNKIHGE